MDANVQAEFEYMSERGRVNSRCKSQYNYV